MAETGDAEPRESDDQHKQAPATLKGGLADRGLTGETFFRVKAELRARTGRALRGLVAHLPAPRRPGAATTATTAACRRMPPSADLWLRGWPPLLRLPTGEQNRFTIGRELACDMTLTDATVSRWHACPRRHSGDWLLDDLGSTNGTRLNGWRVSSPSLVTAGDVVSFGAATFVLADRPR